MGRQIGLSIKASSGFSDQSQAAQFSSIKFGLIHCKSTRTLSGSRMGRHRHKKVSDKDAEENITKQLVESGKREELKNMLAEKLEECGWKDQVKMACRDAVKEKGLDRITVEDLEVAPQGSQLVPDDVKKELLREIRTFLEQ